MEPFIPPIRHQSHTCRHPRIMKYKLSAASPRYNPGLLPSLTLLSFRIRSSLSARDFDGTLFPAGFEIYGMEDDFVMGLVSPLLLEPCMRQRMPRSGKRLVCCDRLVHERRRSNIHTYRRWSPVDDRKDRRPSSYFPGTLHLYFYSLKLFRRHSHSPEYLIGPSGAQ